VLVSAVSSKPRDPSWDADYRDERDAAFLYRALADVEPNRE
jgi:hypothetical protein